MTVDRCLSVVRFPVVNYNHRSFILFFVSGICFSIWHRCVTPLYVLYYMQQSDGRKSEWAMVNDQNVMIYFNVQYSTFKKRTENEGGKLDNVIQYK